MKKILISLLIALSIIGAFGMISTAAGVDRQIPIVKNGIKTFEGIEIIDTVPGKITYGDKSPAPRLKINGQVLVPGEDFDWYYRFTDTNTYMEDNYIYLARSGECGLYFDATKYTDIYNYLKDTYGYSHTDLHYICLAIFSVKKLDLSTCEYTVKDIVYDIERGSYGHKSYPTLYKNGNKISGYSNSEFENLDTVGTAYCVVKPSTTEDYAPTYGELRVPYQIKPHPLNTDEFNISYYFPGVDNNVYNGKPIVPVPKVRIKGYNSDYLSSNYYVECEGDNVNVGTVKAKIIGKNNLTGEYEFTFNIVPRAISDASYKFDDYEYTGYEIKAKPSSVTFNGMNLKSGKDYKIVGYEKNIDFVSNFGHCYGHCIIEGSGNYKGEKTCLFEILPCNISKVDFDIARVTYERGGTYSDNFAATATYNGKEYHKDTDYTVRLMNDNSGKYRWMITGEGNFTGYIYRDVEIDPRDINEFTALVRREDNMPVSSFTYTGSQIKPPRISLDSLEEDRDFEITSYGPNIDVGKGYLTLKGIGNYCGTKKVEFNIVPYYISFVDIKPIAKQVYNGSPITPEPVLTYNGMTLIKGKDYTLSYSKNDAPGKATISITGIGNYSGSKDVEFTILNKDYKIIVEDIPDQEFTLEFDYPVPGVTLDGEPLIYDKDYTVKFNYYFDNGYLDITGIATVFVKEFNYVEEKTFKVRYGLFDYALPKEAVSFDDVYYTGKAQEPLPKIDESLTAPEFEVILGRDYTLTYSNNVNAGTASVTIEGIGHYIGTKTFTFNILPISLEKSSASVSDQISTGKALTPAFDLKLNGKTLVKDKDYTVKYADNVKAGTGKATVTGKGNYTGSKVFTFKIAAPTDTPTPLPTATSAPGITGQPNVTTGPEVTTSPDVTTNPSVTKPSEDPKVQIMDFVKRIYIYVLDREPEEEGAAYWSEELWAFRRTGAEVAQGFIFSEEFVNRNTSDKEFVTILYKTFFGRDPEEDGMNFWLTQLSTGIMDRVTVANGFIYSQEWADTCASYGIRSGGELKPNGTIEPTELTYAFVERMYTTAMGRGYDEEGRQYWAGELANFNITGEQVGASFFLSEEMNGYNLSDAEFLGRLYQTFMNREADEGGAAYWLGIMASGTPRADIVYGFTRSPEFTEKCVEARILPY